VGRFSNRQENGPRKLACGGILPHLFGSSGVL
jgi:hypothetical protein